MKWPTRIPEVEELFKEHFHHSGTFEINDDLSVSVDGGVRLKSGSTKLEHLAVRFKHVATKFTVRFSMIESLDGGPLSIGGDCEMEDMEIQSLAHSPVKVGGSFNCSSNYITSLQGGPTQVGKDYNASNCKLTTPKGAPQVVPGVFDISHNKLENLHGLPVQVGKLHLSYDEKLPLLPLMLVKVDEFIGMGQLHGEIAQKVQKIINKYANQGRKGALEAQRELIEIGAADNARF